MAKQEWHGMLDEEIDFKLRSIQLEANRKLLKSRIHISRAGLVNECLKRCFEAHTQEQIIQDVIDAWGKLPKQKQESLKNKAKGLVRGQ